MRDDHASVGDVRRHLRQPAGDVFVRQPVEAIPSDALGIITLRNGEVVRDGTVAVMKSGVEAADLRKAGGAGQQRADRGEVVGLVQRRERDETLEIGEHGRIDQDRPVVARAAMDDPMPDRDRLELLRVAQPRCRRAKRGGDVGHALARIGLVDQNRAVGRNGAQARPRADAVNLALDQAAQRAGALDAEYLELDAGRACIDDENRVHGVRPLAVPQYVGVRRHRVRRPRKRPCGNGQNPHAMSE